MEEILAKAVTIDDRKEWYCRFCSDANVWTRSKCRRCQTTISSVVQGKRTQVVSNRGGRSWSEWSSSGECEDKVLAHKAQWATLTELRELRDNVKWYESEGRKQWAQDEPSSEEGRFEENEKMEMDEEIYRKKKLDQPEKELVKLFNLCMRFFDDIPRPLVVFSPLAQVLLALLLCPVDSATFPLFCIFRCSGKRLRRLCSMSCSSCCHFSLSTSFHILRYICEHTDSSQLFGQQLQKAYLAEVELDLEIRGLQTGDEARLECISVQWVLHGPRFLATISHVRSRLGQTAACASPTRVRKDVWNAASAGASHSSAPPGREEKDKRRSKGPPVPGGRNEGFLAGSVGDAAMPPKNIGEGDGDEFNSPKEETK